MKHTCAAVLAKVSNVVVLSPWLKKFVQNSLKFCIFGTYLHKCSKMFTLSQCSMSDIVKMSVT